MIVVTDPDETTLAWHSAPRCRHDTRQIVLSDITVCKAPGLNIDAYACAAPGRNG